MRFTHDIWNSFYRAEFDNVVFFVMKYVKNKSQAKDIAQDAFMTLWDTKDKIDPTQNLRTYVYTIARNKALNSIRNRSKVVRNSLENREAQIDRRALSSEFVTLHIDALELEKSISRVYQALPERVRTTFYMSREKGMTYNEIAEAQNISVKAVEYHISIALKAFRKRLSPYMAAILIFVTMFYLG